MVHESVAHHPKPILHRRGKLTNLLHIALENVRQKKNAARFFHEAWASSEVYATGFQAPTPKKLHTNLMMFAP